jgi:hypothetical protein
VWKQAGEDGPGRAWERRWRSFPRLLVVLVGTSAAGMRPAVADLRLAAEETVHVMSSSMTFGRPPPSSSRWSRRYPPPAGDLH